MVLAERHACTTTVNTVQTNPRSVLGSSRFPNMATYGTRGRVLIPASMCYRRDRNCLSNVLVVEPGGVSSSAHRESREVTLAEPPGDGISSVKFAPSSNLLATSSWDTVRVQDMKHISMQCARALAGLGSVRGSRRG